MLVTETQCRHYFELHYLLLFSLGLNNGKSFWKICDIFLTNSTYVKHNLFLELFIFRLEISKKHLVGFYLVCKLNRLSFCSKWFYCLFAVSTSWLQLCKLLRIAFGKTINPAISLWHPLLRVVASLCPEN